jgi:hypothetical protein
MYRYQFLPLSRRQRVKAIKIDSDVACRHCSQAIPDSDSDSGDEFGTRVSPYEQTGNESDHDVQRIQPNSNSDEPTQRSCSFSEAARLSASLDQEQDMSVGERRTECRSHQRINHRARTLQMYQIPETTAVPQSPRRTCGNPGPDELMHAGGRPCCCWP